MNSWKKVVGLGVVWAGAVALAYMVHTPVAAVVAGGTAAGLTFMSLLIDGENEANNATKDDTEN